MNVEVTEREGWKERRDLEMQANPGRIGSYIVRSRTSRWTATITGLLWGCEDCGTTEEYTGETKEEVVETALCRLIEIRDATQEAIAKLLKMKKEG